MWSKVLTIFQYLTQLFTKDITEEAIDYQKDSFSDRFCDDLTEVILNYLNIEDKLRLNCVSKQFRRCLQTVLIRQSVLKVNPYLISDRNNYKSLVIERSLNQFGISADKLRRVLIRLPNITDICFQCIFSINTLKMYNNPKVLDTIIDNCNHLQSIVFNFYGCDPQLMYRFLHKYRKSLKQMIILDQKHILTQVLANCHNLETFQTPGRYYCKYFKHKNTTILSKSFRKVGEIYLRDDDIEPFDHFLSLIPDITHLDISFEFFHSYDNSLNDCVHKLSKLSSLQVLDIKNFCFGDQLAFKGFNAFHKLRKLKYECFPSDKHLIMSFVKHCKQLTHLELRLYGINDHFFDDIHSVVPQLKALKIQANIVFTNQTLILMSNLKHLKELDINCYEGFKLITDLGIKSLAENCIHLKSIVFHYESNFTEELLKCLIRKANNYPKVYFNYHLPANNKSIDLQTLFDIYPAPMKNIEINISRR